MACYINLVHTYTHIMCDLFGNVFNCVHQFSPILSRFLFLVFEYFISFVCISLRNSAIHLHVREGWAENGMEILYMHAV